MWQYTLNVKEEALACPMSLDTRTMSSPLLIIKLANVCLRSWKRILRMPARLSAG